MTTEQKAKAYDEALKRARECHVDGLSLHQPVKDVLEYIFHELKESEDERIRKEIIATIHLYYGEPLEDEAKEMIAWLKKQDEPDGAQKVISKVGFIFGAEWADENPRIHHGLSPQSVWHDSNKEQPQLGSDIVVLQGKTGAVMNNTISVDSDRIWAYINDLLDIVKKED